MKKRPISPAVHCTMDYALVGSLLLVPALLGFSKQVRTIYASEALVLLGYIAVTDSPVALKPIIPFTMHGKIDPFNILGFALQTFLKPFREDKPAQTFNIAFTAVAAVTNSMTDWEGSTK